MYAQTPNRTATETQGNVFFTGGLQQHTAQELSDEYLLFLLKPSPISDIENVVQQVLKCTCTGRLKNQSRHALSNAIQPGSYC